MRALLEDCSARYEVARIPGRTPLHRQHLLASAAIAISALLLGGCIRGPAGGTATGTVTGRVTAAPGCPVERVDQPCPALPISAPVNAVDSSGNTLATTTSGADGSYSLTVTPGSYQLVVVTQTFPRCPSTPVSVTAGAT